LNDDDGVETDKKAENDARDNEMVTEGGEHALCKPKERSRQSFEERLGP